LESHFQPPMSMAMLMGGWFEEMDRRMKLYGRMRSAGVLLPLDRRGHLDDGKLEFKFQAPHDHDLLRRALATLTKVHFHAGALEVWPAIRANEWLTRDQVTTAGTIDEAKIDAFYARVIREKDDATLSSAHPHGGNPMHPDPAKGVVGLDCKVHGTENVLVTDASVFPACIGVNAQYTVMAIAHLATQPVAGAPPI
ncbi:MAG TPA: GMC family oxidoreductase, partial [Reyranella sp.]|nr:GMC family oxidoreductase [Reyranella sp.]